MARTNPELIRHIRNAAKKLNSDSKYEWGHMGSCNCGFLAQEISRLSKAEIHERAMQKYGDWNEQVEDYCPTSGFPMDDLISEMLNAGLDRDDLKNIETLSDHEVLQKLPSHSRNLRHNLRDDVVLYMNNWADILEEKLLDQVVLEDLKMPASVHK